MVSVCNVRRRFGCGDRRCLVAIGIDAVEELQMDGPGSSDARDDGGQVAKLSARAARYTVSREA